MPLIGTLRLLRRLRHLMHYCFFLRYVLGKDLGDIPDAVRAKRRRRLPVVLIRLEVETLLGYLNGLQLLMGQILHGGGLRLNECIKLRIKEIDFERECIRGFGKGDKERETLLPAVVKVPLKHPNAGNEWGW